LLRILAGISLLLALPHIDVISLSISAKIAENAWLVENMGWLF
jgi:hypothetical protein